MELAENRPSALPKYPKRVAAIGLVLAAFAVFASDNPAIDSDLVARGNNAVADMAVAANVVADDTATITLRPATANSDTSKPDPSRPDTSAEAAQTAVMGAVTAAALLVVEAAESMDEWAEIPEIELPESVPVVGLVAEKPTPQLTLDQAEGGAATESTVIRPPQAISNLVANYPEKLLMLVFWSVATETDSPSFVWLNEMHRRYANRGLQILAVNQDKEARQAEAFAVKHGAQFEVSHDRRGDLRRALWVGKLPMTFLLNDAGQLLGSHTGFNDDIRGSYEDEIRRLLRGLR